MKTKVYSTYGDFLARTDMKENGVSEEFAQRHTDYAKQNETNKGCWDCSRCSGCSGCSRCSDCFDCSDCSGCSRCSRCSGCSDCFDCSDCSGCSRCSRCSGCSDCFDCSDCSGCSGCSRCSDCSRCSGLKNARPVVAEEPEKSWFDVPKIENIHRRVLEAVSKPDALNMKTWHSCETTHCRGGWVVALAGAKGKALEVASSTLFAAMQIYHASSPISVSPARFFETDEVALADIKRCAEEEEKL